MEIHQPRSLPYNVDSKIYLWQFRLPEGEQLVGRTVLIIALEARFQRQVAVHRQRGVLKNRYKMK